MAKIFSVKIGGSVPFKFDRGTAAITDWALTIYVRQFPGGTDLITPRVIVPTSSVWSGFLTSTETSTFTVTGKTPNYLIAELVNATTDESEQILSRLHVTPDWAS